MADKTGKTNGTKKEAAPKIDVKTAFTQAQNAIKVLEYLEVNAGFKSKTVRYAKVLTAQWAQALLVKDQEAKGLAELKARQKKELADARARLAAEAKAKFGA